MIMKHIFIVNPKAGKYPDKIKGIQETLDAIENFEYEIYGTKGKGDATIFVREYLENHPREETYRFYACGGDGTLHDTANGIFGFGNAELACYACGSGNDFIKNFPNGMERFKDLKALIKGQSSEIDILKVDDKVCLNILNLGFDGEVTFAMHKYRKIPGIKGPLAYNLAAVSSLLFKMTAPFKVTLDEEVVFDNKGLLCVVANGFCYGGGFYCAPRAKIDDGLIDVCIVKKISRFKAAGLMKVYKAGKHLDNEKIKKYIIYKNCKKATFESLKQIAYAIDGEIFRTNRLTINIIPKSLKFVIPQA